MLGLLACAGYTTVKFIIDDRVRTSDDIERLNMTMLGMLPLQSNKPKDIKANKRGGTT